ncbi:hypothetical protein ACOME3_003433 [Neoechinorhynchus agilis]
MDHKELPNIAVPLQMFKYYDHQCTILEHVKMDCLFSLGQQMLMALEKLKYLNNVHGDMKSGNVVFVNCSTKMCLNFQATAFPTKIFTPDGFFEESSNEDQH